MRTQFFDAQWKVMVRRWPWDVGEEEAMRFYRDRLKAAVLSLEERPFGEAVERLVARDWNNRPSAAQIVAESKRGIQAPAQMLTPEELAAQSRAWLAGCEVRRNDPALRADAIRGVRRGLFFWQPGSRERRIAIEWLRDFWGDAVDEAEFARLMALPCRQMAKSARKGGPKEPVPAFREPGEEG